MTHIAVQSRDNARGVWRERAPGQRWLSFGRLMFDAVSLSSDFLIYGPHLPEQEQGQVTSQDLFHFTNSEVSRIIIFLNVYQH